MIKVKCVKKIEGVVVFFYREITVLLH